MLNSFLSGINFLVQQIEKYPYRRYVKIKTLNVNNNTKNVDQLDRLQIHFRSN